MLYYQIQDDFPPLFHAVGCICRSREKILLLKRANGKSYPDCWGIPTGKMEENESQLRAMVRELYEETGVLLSSENLNFVKTYHVVAEEMSFLYTVYQCQFNRRPRVKISTEEHKQFDWFTLEDIIKLNLVPDLEGCLRDIFPFLDQPIQLELFPWEPNVTPSTALLERDVRNNFPNSYQWNEIKVGKPWYASLGPPASGKTTVLKAMAGNNFPFIRENTILKKEF